MHMLDQNRVIGRRGARELTPAEVDLIPAAGTVHTEACTGPVAIITITAGDGDSGCNDTDATS